MKTNFFKYIFIIFIIAIIIYSIYAIYFKDKSKTEEIIETPTDEEVEEKKDLRFGISNFDSINPLISKNKEILNIDKLIFEPLMMLTNDYKLENCLATECSKISDTSYVIKIDTNKKWHNGSPLMAKDIQFTIDRLKDGQSIYAYNVEKVESLDILDSSTVRINLSEPVEFFEYNLTFPILPNNYYFGENFYESTKTPIGTGMYEITSIDANNIELTKNTNWWNINNMNAKIDKINIKIFSEMGEVYNSFKLGNIDVFTTTNYNLENYIGTIGYVKNEFKGREFDYLAFNCEHPVLKNIEVRQAIATAIDKANIVSVVFSNNYYPSDFPLDYGNYLYNKEKIYVGYGLDAAKKFLQDAGWEYKYNRWQRYEEYRTNRINLSLTVNKDDEKRVAVAENIRTQLAQIGINITIKKVSTSQYNSILENKNYEILLTGVYNSFTPDISTFFGENNLQNYHNEEVSKILEEIRNTSDQSMIKDKYDRLEEIYNDELPFLGLYRNKVMVIKGQNIAGEVNPNNYFSYYSFNTWSRY